MISYLKRYKYQNMLQSHANYEFVPEISTYNLGASIGIVANSEDRKAVDAFCRAHIGKTTAITSIFYSEEVCEEASTYCKKDVTWYGVPIHNEVSAFLEKEYDRLFFISTEMATHQRYICQLAKSRFTIGPFLGGEEVIFDLSIQVKHMSIEALIKEMANSINLLSNIS